MVSEKLIRDLSIQFCIDKDKYEIGLRLQDFTDEEIMQIGKAARPETFWDLLSYCRDVKPTEEVNDHTLGWESRAQQIVTLEMARNMQRGMNNV